ncbi:hypothetical protein DW895_01510 [Firmicutes bacterium AM41-11]|nr:hypothetical protein DW895_01510 [Firmicutes bacterium AM41-11]CRH85092.1 Uncharacterised protein [Chlamydia trachomatis]
MSNTKLDFVKTYIINAIFFVLAYSFPFIGIVLLAYAVKKEKNQIKLYVSCGILLSFLVHLIQFFC